MSNFLAKKNKLFSLFIVAFTLFTIFFAGPVYADPNDLIVDFETTPLFSEADFFPGSSVERYAQVTNNLETEQIISVEAINISDLGSFADVLNIVIEEDSVELYNASLANFFDDGQINLSSLAGGGASTQYDFTISFNNSAGNPYQEDTLQFDLLIGFAGDEGSGDDDGDDEGGGGGGGGFYPRGLVISNEAALYVSDTTVTIIWNTSFPATSRVVYGTTLGAFDFYSTPNYGFAFSTAEFNTPADSSGVTLHMVPLNGLTPDTEYYFRVISHASPDTISYEHSFRTLALGEETEKEDLPPEIEELFGVGGADAFLPPFVGGDLSDSSLVGEIREIVDTNNNIAGLGGLGNEIDDVRIKDFNNLATVLFALPDGLWGWAKCLVVFLVILLIIFFLWSLLDEKRRYSEPTLSRNRNIFFLVSLALAFGLAYLFKFLCITLPLVVAFLVALVWLVFSLFKKQQIDF